MEIYNIKIININKNEYNGTVIIEDNEIRGLGIDKNYDIECVIRGKILKDRIHFDIISEIETKYSFDVYKTDIVIKNTIAPSEKYYGNIVGFVDGEPVRNLSKEYMHVTLTNIKSIKKEINNKVLSNKITK